MLLRSALCLLFAASTAAVAQETRGMIFGRVTDATSSPVPRAKVAVRNTGTNVQTDLATNDSGYYEAPLLVAGTYVVAVEAPGFRKSEHPSFELQIASRLEVNFRLEVGAVSDSITVQADPPLIDSDTLSSGWTVDAKNVLDLPWPGGNSMVLAKLTVGVQTTDTISDWSVRLHSGGPGVNIGTSGGVGGNDYSIDGTSSNANNRGAAFNPAPEFVQAMKMETSAFDASQGHSTGIVISVMTRAGTNQFHGVLREGHHQYSWNALDFFAKQNYYNRIAAAKAAGNPALAEQIRASPALTPGRENQFAGAIGGPVIIPKLFNGSNRLFFFFGYAGFRVGEYRQSYNAFPTSEMRRGDFSSLLKIATANNPNTYQIYDPLTTVADPTRPGHVARTPLAGNLVPQSRIVNPVYKFYSGFLPNPNTLSDASVEPNRDYTAYSALYTERYNSYVNRFDYNISSSDRFFVRWSWNEWKNYNPGWQYYATPNLAEGSGTFRRNTGIGLDWVHNFGARLLLDVAAGSNYYINDQVDPVFQRMKPSDLGFPTYLDVKTSSAATLPSISWNGWTSFTPSVALGTQRYRVLTGKADLSYMATKHTVRSGFDARGQFFTGYTPGNNAGIFNFSSTYTQRTDDGSGAAGTGNYGGPWAAFMMGIPTSISADFNATQAYTNPYFGVYVHDTWRVNQRLTLNLGVRLEYELGPTDRYNRLIGEFDPTAVLPITAAAKAAYAAAPIAEVGAAQFAVLGGATFPGVNGTERKLWNNALNWMPRIAAAYQIGSRTVVRAGFGRYFDTLNVENEGPSMNQLGFSWPTGTTITNDFGQTWNIGNPAGGVSPMTNPFPVRADGTRFDTPPGSALGPMAPVGRSYTFIPHDRPHARQNRWRLDVQRQFGSSMVINLGYAGSYSDRIPINQSVSALPAQYWSYDKVRNNTVANNLNTNLANPYNINNFGALRTSNLTLYQYMAANSFFTSTTIRKSALLAPFPQMNGLTQTVPLAKAKTEEFGLSFQRRMAKGFNVNLAYTRLWNYAADYFPNPFDASPAWQPSNKGRPHRLTSTAVAQLPFGKRRKWLTKGPASWVAGGFQATMIQEYQPGALATWTSTTFYSGSDPTAVCGGGPHILGQWFDTTGFTTNSAQAANTGQARVFPNLVNGYRGCRGDSMKRFNLSLQREFRLKEGVTLQFRGDAYNIGNRSQFGLPVTNPTSTDFGKVTATIAGGGGGGTTNRSAQVQARLTF
jgi:hypothetical protein